MKGRTKIPVFVCILYVASLYDLAQSRIYLFEDKDTSDGFTRPSEGAVDVYIGLESGSEEPHPVQTALDSTNVNPQEGFSLFTPITHPMFWALKKLEEIEASQRSAMNNLILGQFVDQQEGDLVSPHTESMLRHVGCQRYKNAMREYTQMASQEFDKTVQVLESDWVVGSSFPGAEAEKTLAALSSSISKETAEKEGQKLVYMLDSMDTASREASLFGGDLASSSLLNSADDDNDDGGWGGASIVLLGGSMNEGGNTQHVEGALSYSQEVAKKSAGEGLMSQQREAQQLMAQQVLEAAAVQDAAASSLYDLLSNAASQGLLRSEDTLELLRGHNDAPHSYSLLFPGGLSLDYLQPRDGDVTKAAAALWARRRAEGNDATSASASSATTTSTSSASDTYYALAGNTLFDTVISLLDDNAVKGVVPQAALVELVQDYDELEAYDLPEEETWNQGQKQKARRAGGGSGLDVDFDGKPELMLLLVDPVTGAINSELVLLLVLLFCVAMMVANFVHSWTGLLKAMSKCRGITGQMMVPVWVLRDGQMVQENVLLKDGDEFVSLEDDFIKGAVGLKHGQDLKHVNEDVKAGGQLPEVVVASEFAAEEKCSKL
ncbi:hypothetical protein CEUSTIGMA_g7969.t1 [Chlamydomonas eustigma]|uniref:Uncharacterized protein n=1 Tax=Chlamydomonas eustigma TaxID=1157962 RepID=A0A250XBS9_9CHLO|nr:hypothetical protein CEUSTIGMA_g7969.t1 [Chlamydomonas eustigma]|eukprot:GAX80531.1 hypothetical protein CEUSTIGMA_g7969.t1 [Chlamydomonas eustigma]